MKTIYNSLIYPHLQYGIIFWSGVCKSEYEKVFRLQKRAVRVISKSLKYAHTEPIFKNLKILKLEHITKLEMCKFISQDLNNFNNFSFRPRSTVHQHNTRFNSQLVLPIPRNNIMLNSVFYKGLLLYNGLPDDFKSIFDKNMFKVKLKTYFLSLYV